MKAINQCIEKINARVNSGKADQNQAAAQATDLEFNVDNLLTLLDWATIHGKSQAKLDTLKQQLEQRDDSADMGNLLRRISLTISNAYYGNSV